MVTRPFFNKPGLFVLSVFFIASMIAGSRLYAQNEDAPKGKPPEGKQHGEQNGDDPMGKRKGPPPEGKIPEDMADHMSKMLTEKLSLTSDQTTKVYDIVLAYAGSHDRTNFDHKELDGKIEVVLNDDQKNQFREFIKNGPNRNAPPGEGNDDAPPPGK